MARVPEGFLVRGNLRPQLGISNREAGRIVDIAHA
jgi:hypothetical protein